MSIIIIALLYLETRRCRYQSNIFVSLYLYIAIVIFIDYSDMGKMMDINNDNVNNELEIIK